MSEPATKSKLWRDRLPIDWLTKVFALAGGVLYGVLFVAYRLYYEALDLRPESGGIDSAFLAPRAVGMGLLCFAISGCLALFLYPYVLYGSSERRRSSKLLSSVFGLVAVALLFALFTTLLPNLPVSATLTGAIIAIVGIFVYGNWASKKLSASPEKGSHAFRLSVAIAVIAAFVLPTAALWVRASELGNAARQGIEFGPYQVLGLPVLDVRAYRATLRWAGSDHSWPPEPFGSGPKAEAVEVLVVARDSATVTLLAGMPGNCRVLRLNAAQVSLTYQLKSKRSQNPACPGA